MGENNRLGEEKILCTEKDESARDMPCLSVNDGEKNTPVINLCTIASNLPQPVKEQLLSAFDLKKFAKIFEDESMMLTAKTFISSGMNVSVAARKLYMHRNTLMYRLGLIRRKTGLDLKNFEMAVTFEVLHLLYLTK